MPYSPRTLLMQCGVLISCHSAVTHNPNSKRCYGNEDNPHFPPPPHGCKGISRRGDGSDDVALQAEMSPVLAGLIKDGLPLTRENYVGRAYLALREEWTAAHEMMLPAMFRQDPLPKHPYGYDYED